MKMTTLALLVLSAAGVCTAQQKEKQRPGPFAIFGPVRIIRDERAAITIRNGEPVEGPRVLSQIIAYSQDGTKMESTLFQPDGSVGSKIVNLSDPDGRLLETAHFDGKGDLRSRRVNTYDDQKNLVEVVTYRGDGSVENRITFVRQGNQRVSHSTLYSRDGAVLRQGTSTTDIPTSKGESFSYGVGPVISSEATVSRTPEGGRVFESRVDGKPSRRDVIIPGSKGFEESTRYNPDGTVLRRERYTREFDPHGNFIKGYKYVGEGESGDFVLAEVVYRTIEYYE